MSEGAELRVEIADICCQINCNSRHFTDLLKYRYQGFFSRSVPLFTVTVLIADSKECNKESPLAVRNPDADITVQNDHITMRGTDFHGEFFADINMANIHQPPIIHPFDWFLRLIYSYYLILEGGFLIHAAAVAKREMGYVFFGPSGSGKSTIATLSDVASLSDELAVIRKAGDRYQVFGTPFWKGCSRSVALQALLKLEQSDCVSVNRLSPAEATGELMANIEFGLQNSTFLNQLFGAVTALVDTVDCYNMKFLPDNSFWEQIREVSQIR